MSQLSREGLKTERSLRGLDNFELTVPGNILLMGEYAVLEEKGAGIAMAVEQRARLWGNKLRSESNSRDKLLPNRQYFEIVAVTRDGKVSLQRQCESWFPGNTIAGRNAELAQAVFETIQTICKEEDHAATGISDFSALGSWRFVIDTSEFFSDDGRKLGLGSSAAACLMLTIAFAHVLFQAKRVRHAVFKKIAYIAVLSHRRFQNGSGSGYDIMCSFLGGISYFLGGKTPKARKLAPAARFVPFFLLYQGPKAVHTVSAISLYQASKDDLRETATTYVKGCRKRARKFALARSWQSVSVVLDQAKKAGIDFGTIIGVDSSLQAPSGAGKGIMYKAVGAGNETGIAFIPSSKIGRPDRQSSRPNGLQKVARKGLTVNKLFKAEGRGKLLLFGEHAAVYGFPACGTAIDAQYKVQFVPGNTPIYNQAVGEAIDAAVSTFPGIKLPSGRFEFSSTVPESGGFGSSAAVSVAMTRLLSRIAGEILNSGELWQRANILDSHFHGRASGIDTGLSLRKGTWVIDSTAFSAKPLIFETEELFIVYAATHRHGNTKRLVGEIRKKIEKGDKATQNLISELGKISLRAVELLNRESAKSETEWFSKPSTQKDLKSAEPPERRRLIAELAALAAKAHDLLTELELSSDEIEALVHQAHDAGSPGAKMSGAGSGGAFYAWAWNHAQAEEIRRSLKRRAFEIGIELTVAPVILALQSGVDESQIAI